MTKRLIVLDTETTGLDVENGHRIIEVGCVEIIDRNITNNFFHCYINPERLIDEQAYQVHGISNEFLSDKPKFMQVVEKFIDYIEDSTLVIHNAPFDLGFLREEYKLCGFDTDKLEGARSVYDTLKMARKKSPGKRNTLDALCSRYSIDNTERDLHGALLDAQLLAKVYLKMTQGQTAILGLSESVAKMDIESTGTVKRRAPVIHYADKDEIDLHEKYFLR